MPRTLSLLSVTACVLTLVGCTFEEQAVEGESVGLQIQAYEYEDNSKGDNGSTKNCVEEWQKCMDKAQEVFDKCKYYEGVPQIPYEICLSDWQKLQADCEAQKVECNLKSPIIIDLGLRGFRLTGSRHGVDFDIDADGVLERIGWTAPSTQDAFLARDLNMNGQIDDGKELFGNATELFDGTTADHGYIALSELDEPELGGNGNGYLEKADAWYRDLLLWTDANHDGATQPDELSGLLERDILALDLAYSPSQETDSHGNRFAFVSTVYAVQNGRLVRRAMADVFFVLEDPQ